MSGLTKTQYTVLVCIEEHDGVSQTDLVAMTKVDRSTLAEMLNRMEEKRLIERKRTETDARANAVHIAPAGKKALRGARTAAERAERSLLAMLPAAERTRLVKILGMIVAAAETSDPNARKARRKPAR